VRNDRMILELPNDVLFDSASTAVKRAGRASIGEIAQVLRERTDRRFEVSGHTDDVAIHGARFASNWELSTARATYVVQRLIEEGVEPERLSAAGYSEFHPRVANDSPESRARNRRVDIVILTVLSAASEEPAGKAKP